MEAVTVGLGEGGRWVDRILARKGGMEGATRSGGCEGSMSSAEGHRPFMLGKGGVERRRIFLNASTSRSCLHSFLSAGIKKGAKKLERGSLQRIVVTQRRCESSRPIVQRTDSLAMVSTLHD